MRTLLKTLPALGLLLLGCGVAGIHAQPAPAPAAEPAPPRIELPHDEKIPSLVARDLTASGPDWGVVILKAPESWVKTKGKGAKVAILDTGIDSNHPDLKRRIVAVKDFTGSPFGVTDKQGHGTHCAGSVAADGELPGVAPEADLIAGKVLNDNGSGGVDDIAKGIDWATEQGADVISMSLGGPGKDSFIPPAIKRAVLAGVIVIAAAGNEGPAEGTVGYPGGYAECITVAACDKSRNIASFSSRGPAVFITGPGVNIRSTYPGGQYATMSGTSMATPNIAGVAALWVAAHPEVAKKDRPEKFREALKASTGHTDRNTARGFGLPDATKIVGNVTPVPPTPPVPPVPTPIGSINLGPTDLTPAALARLRAAGITGFDMTLQFGAPVAPVVPSPMPPPPAPVPVPGSSGCVTMPNGQTYCPTTRPAYAPQQSSGWYPGKLLFGR
jgi:subtilisin